MPKKPGRNKTYGFNQLDASALVKLIGTDTSTIDENRPKGQGGGGAAKLFLTPSTGIGYATRSGATITPASATCTQYEWNTTGNLTAVSAGSTATVYNIADVEIAGNVLLVASRVQGYWVVVVAQCGSGGSGSFQSWTQ